MLLVYTQEIRNSFHPLNPPQAGEIGLLRFATKGAL